MYLTEAELIAIFYPPAANMPLQDVNLYLQRANSYAFGIIGGRPTFTHLAPIDAKLQEDGLKAAVALAFECFTKGETAQINAVNGNITEAAPAGYFQRPATRSHQLDQVDKMLTPYAALFDTQNVGPTASDKGIQFL